VVAAAGSVLGYIQVGLSKLEFSDVFVRRARLNRLRNLLLKLTIYCDSSSRDQNVNATPSVNRSWMNFWFGLRRTTVVS
jgi:hypothetical protein